jgi:hypothetical protein
MVAIGFAQNIGAMPRKVGVTGFGTDLWQVLAGQCNDRRRGLREQRQFPAFCGFDRVGGAEHVEIGDDAQRSQMFNRLMRGSVFAQTNGIMGHDIDDPNAHQCRQADRRTAIVGKDQEGAAEGNDPAMERHAGHG